MNRTRPINCLDISLAYRDVTLRTVVAVARGAAAIRVIT